jgi:hypothetical protein
VGARSQRTGLVDAGVARPADKKSGVAATVTQHKRIGMKRLLFALAALAGAFACAGSDAAPTATPAPACQTNVTASVSFENREASSALAVVWDGSTIATLGAGQTSQKFTVAAIIPHSLTFKFANSNVVACSTSTPTLAVCSNLVYWCPG